MACEEAQSHRQGTQPLQEGSGLLGFWKGVEQGPAPGGSEWTAGAEAGVQAGPSLLFLQATAQCDPGFQELSLAGHPGRGVLQPGQWARDPAL